MKFYLTDHGTVWLVHPVDDAADKFLHDTAPAETQFMGKAMAVEARYAQGVADAILEAGGEFVSAPR